MHRAAWDVPVAKETPNLSGDQSTLQKIRFMSDVSKTYFIPILAFSS